MTGMGRIAWMMQSGTIVKKRKKKARLNRQPEERKPGKDGKNGLPERVTPPVISLVILEAPEYVYDLVFTVNLIDDTALISDLFDIMVFEVTRWRHRGNFHDVLIEPFSQRAIQGPDVFIGFIRDLYSHAITFSLSRISFSSRHRAGF